MNDLLLDRITRKIPQIQHIFDMYLIADSLVDRCAVCIDHFHDPGSYRAVAHHSYIYHLLSFLSFFV